MKKIILPILLGLSPLAFGQSGQSVDTYIFQYESGKAYVPLAGATNHTADWIWGERLINFPLAFPTKIGDKECKRFFSFGTEDPGFTLSSDSVGIVNRFMPMGFDGGPCDRANAYPGVPSAKSPVRYLTDGEAPNRIFKVEMYNMGFFMSFISGDRDDYLDIQFWIYETSNIIEIRYGNHRLVKPVAYPYGGGVGVPMIGYIKEDSVMYNMGGTYSTKFTKGYNLTGNPNAPVVDSFYAFTPTMPGLTSYPDSGTVYRFIPKGSSTSVAKMDLGKTFTVYPTVATNVLNVDQNIDELATGTVSNLTGQTVIASLILNKGDNPIDISSLASGMYLLQLATAEGKASYKFTKQ